MIEQYRSEKRKEIELERSIFLRKSKQERGGETKTEKEIFLSVRSHLHNGTMSRSKLKVIAKLRSIDFMLSSY